MEHNKKLNQSLVKSKIVYFIGAGFSKILDYPTMSDFVGKCLKVKGRTPSIVSAIEKVQETKDLETILSELDKMLSTKYSFVLEKYINVIDKGFSYKGPPTDEILKTDNTIVIPRIRFAINFIKERIFETYKPKKRLDYKKLDLFFSPIFNSIKSPTTKTSVPIFTTNYDHVIEEYFKSKIQDINIINGFDEENIFDSLILERTKLKKGINVFLSHLHGSIYFYKDKEFNQIKYIEISSYLQNKDYINWLIYPTADKTPIEEPFFNYYDYLSRCLDKAHYVLFIGYSFRDFETLIRIRSSLIYNKNLKLIIIDNNSDHLKEKFFNDDNRVESYHYHFNKIDDLKTLSNKLSTIFDLDNFPS